MRVYVGLLVVYVFFFFFKQKTAYEMRISDWSSDVCSSDLMLDNPRFGLIVLEPGRLRTIGGAFSLNDCDFTISLSKGACIAQSQTQPPAIAEIDVVSGRIRPVASVSPRHERLSPLRAEPRTWTRSEEHTSELQSLMRISYAVFCLQKKK